MDEKCAACEAKLERRYIPMREWNMKGPLCGDCYSRLIGEFYPGEHVRMGSQDGGRGGGGGPKGAGDGAGGGPKGAGDGAGGGPDSRGAGGPPSGGAGGGSGGDSAP